MEETHSRNTRNQNLASVVRESRRSRDESRSRANFLTSGLPGDDSTCASADEAADDAVFADEDADDAEPDGEAAADACVCFRCAAEASVEAAAAAAAETETEVDLAATARATAPTCNDMAAQMGALSHR